MLRNPAYVQANRDVYDFFKAQGANIVNQPEDFLGLNGCYIYKAQGVCKTTVNDVKDNILVIAPHEGIIPPELWLTVRRKLLKNPSFQSARKPKNTWLAGKMKCGKCGFGVTCCPNPNGTRYLHCKKRAEDKSCEGAGSKIYADKIEQVVFESMVVKLGEFQTLARQAKYQASPKLTALKVELAHVEDEILKLLDSLTGANEVLIGYANSKIMELDTKKQTLVKHISEMKANEIDDAHIIKISECIADWDNTSFDDRRLVADALIEKISITSESTHIEWKI
jgi:hypothetical protein